MNNAQSSPRQEIATHIQNILDEFEAIEEVLEDDPDALSMQESELVFIPTGRIKKASTHLPDPDN